MKSFSEILKAMKGDKVTIWDYCAPHYNAADASIRIYFDDMEKDTREVYHVYIKTGRVEHATLWGFDKGKNHWAGYRNNAAYIIHRKGQKAISDYCRGIMYADKGYYPEVYSYYKKS